MELLQRTFFIVPPPSRPLGLPKLSMSVLSSKDGSSLEKSDGSEFDVSEDSEDESQQDESREERRSHDDSAGIRPKTPSSLLPLFISTENSQFLCIPNGPRDVVTVKTDFSVFSLSFFLVLPHTSSC